MIQRMSAIVIAAISILVIGVQPVFIGLIAERFALTTAHQSWVIAAEMCGAVFAALLGLNQIYRWRLRSVCISAAAMLFVVNALTANVESFSLLLVLRFISGASATVLYCVAVSHLGKIQGQDRSFGLLLFFQTGVFSLVAACLPLIAQKFGFSVGIYFITAWFCIVLLMAFMMPRLHLSNITPSIKDHASNTSLVGFGALLGICFLQISIYSLWGFIDGIGEDAGITPTDIGWAVGVGILGGLPGGALPSLLGNRLARVPMILAGSCIVLISIYWLAYHVSDSSNLAIAVFLMNFGWILALSYSMSCVVSHDPTGHLTKYISLTQVGSAALAPTFLAVFMDGNGRASMFIASSSSIVLGICILITALIISKRRVPRPAAG